MARYALKPEDHISIMLSLVIQRAPEASRHPIGEGFLAMRITGETDEKILLALADMLVDGLRYGNWPEPR